MKKHLQLLVLLAALVLPMLTQAQRVEIGTGTTTSYSPSPFCNYYNNGMSQTIYLASEINTSGVIDTIWLYSGATATVASTNIHIYLGTTTQSTFTSGFLPASNFDEVYSATGSDATLGGTSGWVPFVLETPYYYAGTDNLVVCCTRQSGNYSSSVNWRYTSQTGRCIYRQSDGDATYGDITGTAAGTVVANMWNIRFHFDANYVAPSCERPYSVTASNVGPYSADISWVDTNASQSGFILYYYPTATPASIDSVLLTSSDDSYSLTGLTGNTEYSVDLVAICDDATITRARSCSFRTACTALDTLPFVMTFESENTGSSSSSTFIPCWGHLNDGTYPGYPYISSSSNYNHTPGGSKGIYWYYYNTTSYGNHQIIVLPYADPTLYPINTLQVKFWATAASGTPQFKIGVMTDPTDATTFQQVATVNVGTGWNEYLASFNTYTGTGMYPAIRADLPTAYWTAYVDDITLEEASGCPEVYNMEVIGTGITSASVSWDIRGGLELPASYDIEITDMDTVTGGSTSTYTATDMMYTFTGLTAGTQYKVRVRATCTSEDGPWDSIMVNTGSLPCVELDPTTADTVVFSSGSSSVSGCIAYSSWGNTAYQTIYTAAELTAAGLQPGPITGIDLGINVGSSYAKELTIYLGNSNVTSITSATLASPAQHQLVYGPEHYTAASGVHHFEFEEPFVWDGTSSIMMTTLLNQYGSSQSSSSGWTGYYTSATNKAAYRYQDSNPFSASNINAGSAGSTYSYRANISFYTGECMTYATCVAPNAMIDSTTTTDIYVSWAAGYDETNWDVDYRAGNSGAWVNAETATTSTSTVIANLSPSTSYQVRVGSVCSDTTVYTILNAATQCGVINQLPYMETFEAFNVGEHPRCWVSTTPTIATYGGSNALYAYIYNSSNINYLFASMPEFDTIAHPLNTVTVSFDAMKTMNYAYDYYSTDIIVGVCSTQGDLSTFVPVDTIVDVPYNNAQMTSYDVNFISYQGGGSYITFVLKPKTASTSSYTYHYIALDNISVFETPLCNRPDNLVLDRVWGDTVDLHWTDLAGQSWEVVYGPHGCDPDTIYDNVISNLSDDTLQITGLTLGMEYDFYVRTDCYGEYSPWRGPVSATPGFAVNMPITGTQSITGCAVTVYDDGGADGIYSASCNGYLTVYPASNDSLLRFYGNYNTESTSYDWLVIYEGTDATGNVLFDQRVGAASTGTIDTMTCMSGPITIWFRSDGSGQYAGFELHTFCIPAPECGDVTDIVVNAGPNSAMVTWTPGFAGVYSGASVEYREADDPTASWITVGTTTGTSIGITGLTELTGYEVRVQATCEDGNASFVEAEFTTSAYACAVMDSSAMIQDTIGNGTGTSTYFPSYSFYENSLTQQIYRVSDFDTASLGGVISAIGFQLSTTSVTREWNIYVSTTSASSLSTSFITISAADLVWHGSTDDLNGSGWNEIDLPTPITLGSDNILVTFQDITGDYTSGNAGAVTSTGISGISRYIYQDGQAFDPTTSVSGGYASADRLNMYFKGGTCLVQETCPAPIVNAQATGLDEVTLSWVPGGSETSWHVYYRAAADSVYTLAGTANTTSYVVSNLAASSQYYFKVASLCDTTSEGGAAEVICWTECGLVSVPFFEDFENEPYGVFSRPCWYNGTTGLGTTYPNPYVISLQGDPNKLVIFYSGGYLVLPEFDAQLNTLQARFTLVQGGDDVRFILGLLDDLNSPITSVRVLDTLIRSELDTTSSSTVVTFPFDFLDDTVTGHLVFWDAFSDNYSFIDDLHIELIPNCTSVTGVAVSNVTSNSADVAWNDNNASSYIVEYGPRGFQLGTGLTVSVTDTMTTLTGLGAGLSYQVYVYAVCGADTAVVSNVASFTTECGAVSLPYTENFDNVLEPGSTAKVLPNCWHFSMTNSSYGSSSYYPTAYYQTTYSHSGQYCLWLYGEAYTVLPEMPTTVDSLMIQFHEYNTGTAYYQLIIGAVDSITPGFEASFTPIDTIQYTGTEGDYLVFLNSYQGTGRYIAFRNIYQNQSYGYSYHYIDDLVVDYLPSCIFPTDFSTAAATTTSADIAWQTSNATDYEYEYGVHGFTRGTGITDTCSGRLAHLTGLTISTTYDIYVRGICGAGDSSEWRMYTFSTLNADPATMPFNCDFTDTTLVNCGFEFVNNGTNNWYIGNAEHNITPMSMYISNNNGTSASYTNTTAQFSYAYRDITIPAGEVAYSFDWQCYGESSYDYLRAWLAPVGFQFTAGQSPDGGTSSYSYMSSNPAGWYPLDGGTKLNYLNGWQNRSGDVTVAAGTYHLVFMWANDGSGGTNPPAIVDNISLVMNTCPAPSNIHAASAGATEIEVDWTDVETPAAWQIRYVPVDGSNYTVVDVASHPYTVTGLDTLTNYNFYVRSICTGADTGRWSAVAILGTSFCDNSQVASTGTPTSTSYYAPTNNYYNYSLTETIIDSAELNGAQDIQAISYYYSYTSPLTAETNVDIYLQPTVKVTFNGASDAIALDTTTAVKVYSGSLNCSEGWNTFMFDTVFSYDGTGNLVVIVDDNSGDYDGSSYVWGVASCTGTKCIHFYTDSYNIDPLDPTATTASASTLAGRPAMRLISCGSATCRKPAALAASNVTYQSADLSWTGTGSSYEVQYKAASEATFSAPVAVTGTSYSLTGLQPAMNYVFQVRQDCSVDSLGYSEWATASFTTDSMPCLAPTNLHVVSVTGTDATLAWTAADPSHAAWDIHVYNTTFDSTYTVTTNPATVGGLQAGVTYTAAIRTLCGDAANIEGEWSDSVVTFNPLTCPTVTGLDTVSVDFNQVVLQWTADQLAQSWIVEYGIHGFNQGSGTTVTVTTPTYTATGLTDMISYDFYVRAVCGTNWESENWQSLTVTTDQAPANTFNVTVNVNNSAWGSVIGGGIVAADSTIILTAQPADHCEFLQWTDGVTANPRTVVVTCDTTFTANFGQIPQYTITVVSENEEMGTVTGGGTYYRGETATFEATANEGYQFMNWTDGNGDNPRTVTVNGDVTYTAHFDTVGSVVNYYTVTLTVNDETMGTVTGAGTYVENSTITIAAIANSGYHFVTWSDGVEDAERTITLTSDVTLEATFAQDEQGIDDVDGMLSCTIYPNPAHSTANISVSGVNGQVRIAVLDMSGRVVASETMECNADCVKSMDVDGLAAGTYFVRVTSEKVNMVKKLIVR